MAGGLITLEEARARLLAVARKTGLETVGLADAVGRTLAEQPRALHDQPPAAMSAMDGYAIAHVDWPGPWRVVGEAAAGGSAGPPIARGEAARIFTGARVPEGADAVLIQEEAAREGEWLRPLGGAGPRAGEHVRVRACDFAAGAAAGVVGTPITPALIGLAAAMGQGALVVHRRPRVAILSTGDELVPPGTAPGPGQIVESCAPMVAAMLAGVAEPLMLGIAPDRADAIVQALHRALGCDAIVTIGGASVGDHDLVRPALLAAGGTIDFWRVAIRPGKPVMAGELGGAVILGLPGNPASAFVTALLFLLPLARALAGWVRPEPELLAARLDGMFAPNGARRDHLRAVVAMRDGVAWATPLPRQDSSLLSVLAAADALIVRPEHAPAAAPGDPIQMLDTRFGRF